ncbi:MAG: hypothetical protein WB663_16970 [Beijerinckiaceae bacterium]
MTFSTTGSTAFTALTVLSIFAAFVTVTAAAGLAATDFPDADLAEAGLGAAGLVTARRLAAFAIALRSDVCAFVLARAASTFWALAVFFFRISTVVAFLSIFLRAAAWLFELPTREDLPALF